jgi:hypothetical protein
MARDPVAAEACRQAVRLESRALTSGDENDMRAGTLLRLFLAMLESDNADDHAGHSTH